MAASVTTTYLPICHPFIPGSDVACYSHGSWQDDRAIPCSTYGHVQCVPLSMCTGTHIDEWKYAGMHGSLYPQEINAASIDQANGSVEGHGVSVAKQGASKQRRERRKRAAAKRDREQIVGQFHAQHDGGYQASLHVGAGTCEELDYYTSLKAQVTAGGDELNAVIAKLRGSVPQYSFDADGCRVVQEALQAASKVDAEHLASELRGMVLDCIDSPHANYVLQKVVEVLPAVHSNFIVAELQRQVMQAAVHRYGCRVLCRLFEHGSGETLRYELIAQASKLCRHKYGQYVAKCLLEHGSDDQKRQMAHALQSELTFLAHHRTASHVVVEALRQCDDKEKHALAKILLEEWNNTLNLAKCPFGALVLKELWSVGAEYSQLIRHRLQKDACRLQTSKCGRKLMNELEIGLVKSWQPDYAFDQCSGYIRAAGA